MVAKRGQPDSVGAAELPKRLRGRARAARGAAASAAAGATTAADAENAETALNANQDGDAVEAGPLVESESHNTPESARALSEEAVSDSDPVGGATAAAASRGRSESAGSVSSAASAILGAPVSAGTILNGPASAGAPTAALPAPLFADVDVDAVIYSLALPDPAVAVAASYANARQGSEMQAYAKLAGRSWTFYVQQLRVFIGRRADDGAEDAAQAVDIDLGPSRIVSRRHALIEYNQQARSWQLTVLGRNGVKVDGVSHKHGSVVLRSGHVLEINGTQMLFVLPDALPQIAASMAGPALQLRAHALAQGAQAGGPHPANSMNYRHAGSTSGAPVAAARPSYPNGVAIVVRPQVRGLGAIGPEFEHDLSADANKDMKPPFSYATMISQAILSTEDASMSLADIYSWIAAHYAFYRHSKPGWQNSIRHNLSLNKAFEKVARKEHEPGKGSKWQITAKYKEEFLKKAQAGKLVKGRSSPIAVKHYLNNTTYAGPMPAMGAPAGQPAGHLAGQLPHHLPPPPPLSGQDAGAWQPMHPPPPLAGIQAQYHHAQGPPHPHAMPVPQRVVPQGPPSLPQGAPGGPPGAPSAPLAEAPASSPYKAGDMPPIPSSVLRRLPDMDLERPYLELLEGDYNAGSPLRYTVTQAEAYTPERGSATSKRPSLAGLGTTPKINMGVLAGSSPALWKYMQFATPVKADSDKSPSRVREDLGALGGVDLRY